MKKITLSEIAHGAKEFGLELEAVLAVRDVESGGKGFGDDGKILIQFEPAWFKKKAPYTPSGLWSVNGVEKQAAEWKAFNDAFNKNATAAMESTSIGMFQIMGFHYKLLGFKTVGEMWDYAKVSELNQLRLALKFILANPKMFNALKLRVWSTFAYYYNGKLYKKYKYDTKLAAAYKKYKG